MTDYKQMASEIIAAVGGRENVQEVTQGISRLCFYLADKDKADSQQVEAIAGVAGAHYNETLNQYQIIIGQAVAAVYDEILAQFHEVDTSTASKKEAESTADSIENLKLLPKSSNPIIRAFESIIELITGAMLPIIGLLAAGGLINGLLGLFVKGNNIFELISPTNPTYIIISTLAMTPFYFLPVLVGFTAARHIAPEDTSLPYIMAAVGAFLLNPNLQTILKSKYLFHFLGVTFNSSYFGLPISLQNYSYTIFPIILAVLIAKPLNAAFKKLFPRSLSFILPPMLTFFIASSFVILIVSPIISLLSAGLLLLINCLLKFNLGLAGIIIGALYQVLVIFGLHWLIVPAIHQTLVTTGESSLNMIVSYSMLAQGAGALTVFLKTKRKPLKALSFSAAIAAFCGVTEPAMYGVNLRYLRIFLMSSIGAAAGAGVAGFLGLHMYGFVGSLIGFPSFVNTHNPLTHAAGNPNNFIIACLVAFVCVAVTMILVWLFGYKETSQE